MASGSGQSLLCWGFSLKSSLAPHAAGYMVIGTRTGQDGKTHSHSSYWPISQEHAHHASNDSYCYAFWLSKLCTERSAVGHLMEVVRNRPYSLKMSPLQNTT